MARVQVIVEIEERELFRSQAKRDGLSLSAWLRAAAHERLERSRKGGDSMHSREGLEAFFEDCNQRESEQGSEPDWEGHLSVIRESRGKGASGT